MPEFAGKEFRMAEGRSEVMGSSGPLFTYSVFVQKGLGFRVTDVARRVDRTLGDERGWTRGGGVRFQRTEDGTTPVLLCAPDVVDALCAPLDTAGEVSCCIHGRVVLNVKRWRSAVPHWTRTTRAYREALINHEWGHRIGKGHGYCPGPGQRHPAMMQFTYGLQGCKENSWPLDSEIPT
jgi:hypothetical protein